MLSESRNGAQPSANNDSLNAPAELQTVSVYIPPQHGGDTVRVNRWDSSPMLDGAQIARIH